MVEHRSPLHVLPEDLEPWLSPDDILSIQPLPGWHNSVFAVRRHTSDYVLRVHVPEETRAWVALSVEIASCYSRRLRYVPAPLATLDGSLIGDVRGRVATLWPLLGGGSRHAEPLTDRAVAACLLAEVHRVGIDMIGQLDGIAPELWADEDWRDNRRWKSGEVSQFLRDRNGPVPAELAPAELADELVSRADDVRLELLNIDRSGMMTLPIHGDFYPHNILQVGGEVLALLDWDEARIDWRLWDLANALIEFCGEADTAGLNMDMGLARSFIRNYEAAGARLTESERGALPSLLRGRKLDEVMYTFSEVMKGASGDWDYVRSTVDAWRQVQQLSVI